MLVGRDQPRDDGVENVGLGGGQMFERLALRFYGIDDIRRLLSNDLRFLRQFWTERKADVLR